MNLLQHGMRDMFQLFSTEVPPSFDFDTPPLSTARREAYVDPWYFPNPLADRPPLRPTTNRQHRESRPQKLKRKVDTDTEMEHTSAKNMNTTRQH